MLARSTRSGLVESVHTGHVVVVAADGAVVRSWGDPEAVFYMRSAAKPFQAAVSQANGAGLSPRQLAVAASSHGGEPVHIAIVAGMLAEVGLGPEHLLCPADWPKHPPAARRATNPQPILHNCSGKHAAMLRACVASGWPLDYTRPEHPLQEIVFEMIADATGVDPRPIGVDGCGIPTLRTTTAGLARAFARLATDPALADVARAMHRYPHLTAGTAREESAIAVSVNAAVKGGAKGCLGVAVIGQYGLAAKSDDGLNQPAAIAVIAAMTGLGLLTPAMDAALAEQARPVVLGGGMPVGHTEPALS